MFARMWSPVLVSQVLCCCPLMWRKFIADEMSSKTVFNIAERKGDAKADCERIKEDC